MAGSSPSEGLEWAREATRRVAPARAEGGGLGFTLGGGFGFGGTTDYWEVIPNNGSRVDAATITTGGVFANACPVGGSVLAGDDTNASGTSPVSVTFDAVNVSGWTNLTVKVLLAASNPTQGSATRGFEGSDFVEIEVSYDSGAFQRLAIYEEDPSHNGGINSYLSQDINGDGSGDGGSGTHATTIEQGFKEFSHAVTNAGTVQIRIRVAGEATGEYVAIDKFRICGCVTAAANTIGTSTGLTAPFGPATLSSAAPVIGTMPFLSLAYANPNTEPAALLISLGTVVTPFAGIDFYVDLGPTLGAVGFSSTSGAAIPVMIPNDTSLCTGLPIYFQMIVKDSVTPPPGGNLPLIATNALEWLIGV